MTPVKTVLATALSLVLTAGLAAPGGAATPREVKRIVTEEAANSVVPPSLALAIANVESGLRDDRQSPEGGRGVMQITPDMAARYGVGPGALWDARANVRLGLRMVGDFFRAVGHDWRAALARYADAMPGGLDAEVFARRVLGQERRFAEEIVVRNEIERRKREVMNLADADAPRFDPAVPAPRRPVVQKAPPPMRVAVRATASPSPDLEARLRAARRMLDDFSAGNIPNDMLRERGRWRRR